MELSISKTTRGTPGLAWAWAALVAVLVAALVWRGALGRALQLQWAWGIDGGYFLQRTWQGAVDPFAPRTLFWDEAGSGTHGGRHHSPIVSLFVGPMALRPHLTTLLATQALVLGAGVLPLFALCWNCVRRRGVSLLLLCAALSVPGFFAIGVGDFRLLAPALVLVPACIGAAVFGTWPAAFAATVLACSVREEIAPLLLFLLPFLVSERARREQVGWKQSYRIPILAVGLPAVLWHLITMWRADLQIPGQLMGFAGLDGTPAWRLPLEWAGMLLADVRGDLTDPPRLLLRLLAVGGVSSVLFLRRPWALAGLFVFWVGASENSGVVNPGQVHYYAPLVGLYVALVPLALTGWARGGLWVPGFGAALLLVGHALLPALPVSVGEAWDQASHEAGPEWELAATIGPDESVLASGWLLPTVSPRQQIWCTCDLRDSRFRLYERVDVVFLMMGESYEEEVRAAGFVQVARANQGMLFRRPGAEPADR